ncbi:hypothetical protein [Paraconexibacter sp. AEG42_29]|uniref:hypothetical protein n=1 Tax=Paraconexibacter sp. AEG42_29 TaxID=2997339 RepID=UPI00339D6F41
MSTPASTERIDRVARVLLDRWDVLGIRDLDDQPVREYASEAAALVTHFDAGANEQTLAAALAEFARDMGQVPDARRDRAAARSVLAELRVG